MAGPIRSMTGFARVRRTLGNGELLVSVKTLNHRGLDIQVHASSAVDPYESAIRGAVKNQVARGHVEVRVVLPKNATGSVAAVNKELLDAYIDAFKKLTREHRLNCEPDLNAAFRLPGMFGEATVEEAAPGVEPALLAALHEALDHLNEFRVREGAEIAAVMRDQNASIHTAAAEMERLRSGAVAAFRARLSERLKELLAAAPVDPQRLAQEAALLADRSDIGEEIARLKIHAGQLDALLTAGGEVGKKVDFLLQEMNRETNTVLSKTGGVGEAGMRITELALAAKSAIEKIREQTLNLE